MSEGADETRVRRARLVRIYEVEDRMVVLGRDGNGHELAGDSAGLARAVLSFFGEPNTTGALLHHLERLTGAPLENPQVVRELVQLLRGLEVLEVVKPGASSRKPRLLRHGPVRVLLGLTGAVGSMYAPAMIQALQLQGFVVRVMATEQALRFVRAEALEALTHERVIASLWPTDERIAVPHINLAKWADAVVISPASATTISRLATADHGCVVAATALATRAPVLVVPSMNPDMYASPGVQRNLEQIAGDGMHVAHPAAGFEMADAPAHRVPLLGASPPPQVIVQLLEAMLRDHARRSDRQRMPRSDADWDAIYGQRDASDLPWHTVTLDDDIAEVLSRLAPPPSSVLDVGTGLGTLAVECARRGHRVVATDVSGVALERAHAQAPDAPVAWVEDDITASKLHGSYDAIVDRGCLHLLGEEERAGYATSVARLAAAGGLLIVKTLAGPSAEPRGTTPYTARKIEALLGDSFSLLEERESTLAGPQEALGAHIFVLRRKSEA